MADHKVVFSLDLTTEQAKRAVDDFVQQLQKAGQAAGPSIAEWNKIGTSISDSFKKALQDVKTLQQQIQDEMKKGVSGMMQPGSPNSLSGKLVDGLKEMIKSEHETVKSAIKTTEQELAKNRDEYNKMVKDLDSKKLDPETARTMASKQDKINALEGELKTRNQASAVLSDALQRQAPTAQDVLQQLTGGGKPPGTPPPPPGPPPGQDPFRFAGKAGALMQLLSGGGNLTSLISGSGMMSILAAMGGAAGGMLGTGIITIDALMKGMQNRGTTESALMRQYATGGATEVNAELLARGVMKEAPTGAYGVAMRSKGIFDQGISTVDMLDQLRVAVQSGSLASGEAYIKEKLLQEQMGGYGQLHQRAFQGSIERGQALMGVERMFGMGITGSAASSMMTAGIPLSRMQPGMVMMAELMGRLPETQGRFVSAADAQLLNMQNKFGLGDDAFRQVIRAQRVNAGAAGAFQGRLGAAGLGTAETDIATSRITSAGADYASRFDAAAIPGAMGTFMQGFQGVAKVLPGLSPAEQSRYSIAVTNQRLTELNNPDSMANRTAMGSLARLGITDPVEARVIMSMGVDQQRTKDVIAKMTGKTPEQVDEAISGSQKRLTELQSGRFGGGRLDAIMGKDFTYNALRAGTAKDLNAVTAQGGFNPADLTGGGPTGEQITKGRAAATGRQDTTVDLMQEQNAQIAGQLAKLTGADFVMKVRIMKGADDIREQDADTERRRSADAQKPNNLGEPKTTQNRRGSASGR